MVFSLESLFCLINRFKIVIRQAPFIPNDLLLFREAQGVFSFKYIKSSWLAIAIVIVFSLLFLTFSFLIKTKKRQKKTRLLFALSSLIVLFLSIAFVFSNTQLYNYFNSYLNYNLNSIYNDFGFNYAFLNIATKNKYEKPEGYDAKTVKDLITEYETREKKEPDIKPNIIVVQSEGFYDLTLWNAFNYSPSEQPLKNYLNIINSNQAISGRAVTYGFGGGTADSEFEVLTGMSTEFIGTSMPSAFSTINKNTFSINRALGNYGYTSSFYHPGKSWFYNRSNVYRYLGYKNILFNINGFNNTFFDSVGYPLDSLFLQNFKKIYNETPSPSFLTGVTIENHGPYNDHRYNETVPIKLKNGIKLSDESKNILGNYITGLKNGDDMLGNLISFLDDQKDPIILLFYGDHKPFLGDEYLAYRELDKNFAKSDKYTKQIETYETPYFIWSNKAGLKSFNENKKAIDLQNPKELSCFYLGGLLTQLSGYEGLSPFIDFVNEVRDDLPVIHRGHYKTATENYKSSLDKEDQELLKNYQLWQYYLMKEKIN